MEPTTDTKPAKDTRMITSIPFDGFYDSYSDEKIEEAAGLSESDHEYWSDENPQREKETDEEYRERREKHFDKLRDDTDFDKLREEYCRAYVDAFAKDNGLKLEFEKLESPRFYNYTTDRIFCFIEPAEVSRLVNIVDRVKLAALVKEKFTSCDGFSSFYDNELALWHIDNHLMLDHNQIETIIECVTAEHVAEENESYPYIATLMEDFYR